MYIPVLLRSNGKRNEHLLWSQKTKIWTSDLNHLCVEYLWESSFALSKIIPMRILCKGLEHHCGFQGNKRPELFLLGDLSKKRQLLCFYFFPLQLLELQINCNQAKQTKKKGSHTWSAKWSKWCHPSKWTSQFANYFLINQTVVPQGRGAGLGSQHGSAYRETRRGEAGEALP